MTTAMKCPQCGGELKWTGRGPGYLNEEQWDAVKAGDYYCETCKDAKTRTGFKYYRERELQQPAAPPSDDVKPYTLEDYYLAPSGEGPLAAEWRDKPHRLVYDLVKMARAGHEDRERARQTHLRRYARMVEALGRDPGSVDAAIDALIEERTVLQWRGSRPLISRASCAAGRRNLRPFQRTCCGSVSRARTTESLSICW